MTAQPSTGPCWRLVPIPDKAWTRNEDYASAVRILDWVRDAYSLIGYQTSGEPGQGPENVHARRAVVDDLSAAHRELTRLLDRIAKVEMGILDGPLPEVTP